DWSDIIIALGRTYLLDSLFMVYVPEEYKTEVAETLERSRRFYLSSSIFEQLLKKNLRRDNLHRLDVLLFSLYKATNHGSQPLVRILRLFDEVMILQRRLGMDSAHARDSYSLVDCYDAEEQVSFDYCPSILNDLFVFSVSEIVGIDLKYMSSRKERSKRSWKAKYEITPIFDWVADPKGGAKRREKSNLERILSLYPKRITKSLSSN
ncbi:MAG TPA: hypothetical protein VMW36_02455, partial [Patescibacteria group bacterium]|nr:hypothetical protein [Patescibacteria group bacterium]